MALNNYITEVQELLHDPNATYFSTTDLTNYINRARRRIAGRGQCVRVLLSGGTLTNITGAPSGSGYAGTATVTISGAGQQAAATATIAGGQISTVTLTNGGWGYITGTTVTVTATGSLGGSNAVLTAVVDNSLTTVPGQEVYQFAVANNLVLSQTLVPGADFVEGVFSVACAWGANAAMKPILDELSWTDFQAYLRSYNTGLQSFPTNWAKYGQGVTGSVYLWPLPSTASQMDWDCWCLCLNLADDTTPEAIPYPWNTAIAYYAAYLAFYNAQRMEDAKMMKEEYDIRMKEAVTMSTQPFVTGYYQSDA